METKNTIVEVMVLDIESDRDADAVDVTIKLKRHPKSARYAGTSPNVKDLPTDFHEALDEWLRWNV